jgi:RNA polymerase sigma-70 factor (ECF subfamily)
VPDVSDVDLVKQAQRGDMDAIGTLYDRHHTSIFGYLWSRVWDQQLAEDLTGEVFIRMIGALPDYRSGETPFRAWLYRIAHNLMVDHVRKHSRWQFVPLYHAEGRNAERNDPTVIVQQRLTMGRVKAALSEIDPAQQDVIALRFLLGLSLNEVAAVLNKSVAAIKSLQHRGLVALREALKES